MFEFPEERPSWTYSAQHSRFFSKLVESPTKESDSLKILKLAYSNESQESNSSNNDTEEEDTYSDIERSGNVKRPSDLFSQVTSISDAEDDVDDYLCNDKNADNVERPSDIVSNNSPQVSNATKITDIEMDREEGECPPTPPPDDDPKKYKLSQEGEELRVVGFLRKK